MADYNYPINSEELSDILRFEGKAIAEKVTALGQALIQSDKPSNLALYRLINIKTTGITVDLYVGDFSYRLSYHTNKEVLYCTIGHSSFEFPLPQWLKSFIAERREAGDNVYENAVLEAELLELRTELINARKAYVASGRAEHLDEVPF